MTALQTISPISNDAADLRKVAGLEALSGASMKHVAARTGIPNTISGSNTQAGFRSWNYNWVPVTSLRIWFANFYVNSAVSGVETPAGGVLTVRVAVEYPKGTFTSLVTGTIADGDIGYVDVPVTIPAFAWYRINGDQNYLSGGRVISCNWSNTADRGNGDEYQVGNTGYGHALDSTVLGSGGTSAVFPVAVQAISVLPVRAAIGDSIVAGVNDTVGDASGGRGILGRSLAKIGPHLNMGVPGDQAQWFATKSTKRVSLMQQVGVSIAVLELGVNDIMNNTRTSGQCITDRATVRSLLPGVTFLETTITPSTTTTDNWATAANQTTTGAGADTQRTTFNDAMRNGTALPNGLIDIAAMVETSKTNEKGPVLNGGVWIPGMIGFVDGIHPHSRCLDSLEPLITRAISARR